MALHVNDKVLDTDEEGFLLDPSEWDLDVARIIADGEQLDMTDERWEVVNFVRQHFDERGTVPEARHVLKLLEQKFGKEKATRKFLQDLFPLRLRPAGVQDRGYAQAPQAHARRLNPVIAGRVPE